MVIPLGGCGASPVGTVVGGQGVNIPLSFGARPMGRRGKAPCFCKTVARYKGEEGAGEDAANLSLYYKVFSALDRDYLSAKLTIERR